MAVSSVLVANRGEIACRIIRTAQEMGIRTIAVYSEADHDAPHVAMADQAVMIGPAVAQDSYLSIPRLLSAARSTKAEAIHPGYGFLSESATFARAVRDAGLVFVGPPASAIEAMGNKAAAKRMMIQAGVPCLPGYDGTDQTVCRLVTETRQIGLPVMIKAVAGGGGRGMRLVCDMDALPEAIEQARSEARSAFGQDDLILEKALVAARHIEFQVFADSFGNVIHLGERDCSVQRRHQKIIEEAPCPVMSPELRDQMGAAAINAAKAVGYQGAGTVEFLLDADGGFYFLEMNTRLQVEHPVTEMITGLDLVALQFDIAGGVPLPLLQNEVEWKGHAIELRLYAEDPGNGFLPETGRIELWHPTDEEHIRVDAGLSTGQTVSPFYDAMLAKIISWGRDREAALARAKRGVESTVLLGLKTNRAFLKEVLDHPEFVNGDATTAFLEHAYPDGFKGMPPKPSEIALATAILAHHQQQRALHRAGYVSCELLGWSSAPLHPASAVLLHDEDIHNVTFAREGEVWRVCAADEDFVIRLVTGSSGAIKAEINDLTLNVRAVVSEVKVEIVSGARQLIFTRMRSGQAISTETGTKDVVAPMPGIVSVVNVSVGQTVLQGETLAVLEAMKMRHQLTAPFDGVVRKLIGEAGQQVASGTVIMELDRNDENMA